MEDFVRHFDKTLPLNEMVYYIRKDAGLRARWQEDFEGLAREFGLSQGEIEAVQNSDVRALFGLGVHQYLIPHILRLTHGASDMTNTHPALVAYQVAFPRETQAAIGSSKWDKTETSNG
ncbi:MAG: hypothetical protein MRY64_16455 [Hyphomonadaceae bacterium]|nr:hypothetical protein [Hyphomonadaceae bacterium]